MSAVSQAPDATAMTPASAPAKPDGFHGHDTIEVDQAAEEDWTGLIDRGASRKPAFSVSSYYFGSNIPGKPRKYLLNSAGRPKLLELMSQVIDDDYKAFKPGVLRGSANPNGLETP